MTTTTPRSAPTFLGESEQALFEVRAWIRAWSPATPLRWMWRHRRITAIAGIVVLLGSLTIASAFADSGTGASVGSDGSVLSAWTGITDSDGVPVAKYTLSLNEGSWSSPAIAAIAFIDSAMYEGYVFLVATALWIIRFAIDFEWLDGIFADPFKAIGEGVIAAMNKYGLTLMALAALAIVVAITFLAQKMAKAYSHIAMGLLMVAVAATLFANPLADLLGSDGLLAKGRDTGLEIASTVSGGSLKSDLAGGGANIDPVISKLADRFLRAPTQLMNFGKVSDSISRKCKEAWTNGTKEGRGDKLKDDMKGCDEKEGEKLHKKAMGNPGAILAALPVFFMLAAFLIAFALYFTWHIVRTAVQAMFYAALSPPAFAVGVIPGGPQTFAWKTVLDCAMAYLAMVLFTAAFGGYNGILDSVFSNSENNPIKAVVLATVVLAFGFAFFGPIRKMFDRSRDAVAAKIGHASSNVQLPGAGSHDRLRREVEYRAHRRWNNRVDDAPPSKEPAGNSDGGPAAVKDDTAEKGSTTRSAPESESSGSTSAAASGSGEGGNRSRRSASDNRSDESSGAARVRDNLATAVKINQARQGDSAQPPQRHAMSEAA